MSLVLSEVIVHLFVSFFYLFLFFLFLFFPQRLQDIKALVSFAQSSGLRTQVSFGYLSRWRMKAASASGFGDGA